MRERPREGGEEEEKKEEEGRRRRRKRGEEGRKMRGSDVRARFKRLRYNEVEVYLPSCVCRALRLKKKHMIKEYRQNAIRGNLPDFSTFHPGHSGWHCQWQLECT